MTRNFERVAGIVFVAAFVAALVAIGVAPAMRVVGLACMICGAVWIWRPTIGVGIEGRAPSFYVKGYAAQAIGVVMGAFGLFLLLHPALAACVVGWGCP